MDRRGNPFQIGQRIPLLCLLALFGLIAGCTESADIVSTTPAGGATNVAADTNIDVVFSTSMDSEAITNATNVMVMGSFGGAYITTPTYDDATRALTLNPSSPNALDENPNIFVAGETVTVTLTDKITSSIGIPLDRESFSFRIAGAPGDPENEPPTEGTFQVATTDPAPNSGDVSPLPQISVDFTAPIVESSVSGTVFLRGSQSGSRAVDVGTDANAEGIAEQLFVSLATSALFLPGERVSLSLTGAIQGTPEKEGDPNLLLRPFVMDLVTANGELTGDFQTPLVVSVSGSGADLDDITDAAAGDFLINSGLEIVVLDADDGLVLLRRSGAAFVIESVYDTFFGAPKRFEAVDWNEDGRLELVVLTDAGELEFLRVVGGQIAIDPDQDKLTFGSLGTVRDLDAADLTGNGALDFVLTSSTGVAVVVHTPAIEIPGFPEFSTPASFASMTTGIGDADETVVADLDEDGRLDLTVAAGGAMAVYRNLGNINFVFATDLDVTMASNPGALQVADVEGDGDLDVLLPGNGGMLVYLNSAGESGGALPAPLWGPLTLGLDDGTPQSFAVADLDGNGAPDLIAYDGDSGHVNLLRRQSAILTDVIEEPLGASPVTLDLSSTAFLLADETGDGGIDVLLFGSSAGVGAGLVSATTNGVTPEGGSSSVFGVPFQVTYDSSEGEFLVTVTGSIDQEISGFVTALRYDTGLVTLDRVEPDPATFGPSALDLTVDIDPDGGTGVATADIIDATLPAGIHPLVRYVFVLDSPGVGSAGYELANDIAGLGGQLQPNALVLPSGTRIFPDIAGANGTLIITSQVAGVENLQCVANDNGVVSLSWTNPESYDSIEIYRNGNFVFQLPGTQTSFNDGSPGAGAVDYDVVAVRNGIQAIAASCTVTIVPPVIIEICERDVDNDTIVNIAWTNPPGVFYSSYAVFRDGAFLVSGPNLFQYIDTNVDANGHIYQIIASQNGEQSPPTDCFIAQLPAGEFVTEDPENVTLIIQGDNDATLSWTNGESYDSIEIVRFVGGLQDGAPLVVPGIVTQYSDDDLLPGLYAYTVQGFVATLGSNAVLSNNATANLPAPTDLTCEVLNGNDVALSWVNGSENYTTVEVLRDGAVITVVNGGETSASDLDVPDGSYQYTVRGVRALVPQPGTSVESSPCSVAIQSAIRADDAISAPGVQNAELTITGDILDTLQGFQFVLEYDGAAFTIDGVTPNLDIEVPLVGAIVTTSDAPAVGALRRVTVTVSNLSEAPGNDVLLARIFGSVPFSFVNVVGNHPLHLVSGSFTYAGQGAITPQLLDGNLAIFGDAVQIDGGLITAGQGELVVPCYGTYDEAIRGYNVVLQYDPAVLQCTEISIVGTISEDLEGIFIPDIDNASGTAVAVMVPITTSLPPAIRSILLYFVFDVNPATPPDTLTDVVFGQSLVGDGDPIETLFVDELAQTIDPLELDGTFLFEPVPVPPVVSSIAPARGPLAGGGIATIQGSGFSGGPGLQVLFGSTVAPIQAASDTSIVVTVPPSGAIVDTTVGITVSHAEGQSTLAAAYTYEALFLDFVDPDSGDIGGGETVTINGRGFGNPTSVTFGGNEVQAIAAVADDGTTLEVVTPAAAGLGPVDVVVELVDGQTETLVAGFTYTSDQVAPTISSVDPSIGCQGAVVLITGSNFDATLEVLFGGTPAAALQVVSATMANATVPAGPTGVVDVTVQNGGGSDTLPAAFEIQVLSFGSITPDMISTCGGTAEITGTGMEPGLAVFFGSTPMANVSVNADCTIASFTVPQLAEGTYDIVLDNPSGSTVTALAAVDVVAPIFVRGDANGDNIVNLADVVFLANFLNDLGPEPTNPDAGDVNDDGFLSIADVVYLSSFLNAGGAPPPLPFPDPGPDPTPDPLSCL